ncbi:Alpha/Beta hydrolase protein [Lophiotrema nucula]|uniref:Alpha/Beta hydrolase protein n=1 Tax=Lophiotrema nucula TaxID=690887 RepID=A0A6A5Z4S4_9PLEO|nr:Alpha/Beta hydrolase protein [Lophiotrema nucula]
MSVGSVLGDLAWRTFAFCFGIFNFIAMAFVAGTRDDAFSDRTHDHEKMELADAQEKYWDLQLSPFAGFKHKFFTTRNGVKLHYVTNAKEGTKSGKIAIFIHGFPDSYVLWRSILGSPALSAHTLIAVDLPGFGGSDSLPVYDPENVLESLAGFILGIREQYLQEGGKVVMVTHDWGGIVGGRLASEAKELADRWIIIGAVLIPQLQSNANTHIASAKQMLHTWIKWPFNPRLFKAALKTMSPVFGQIGKSFYIFILQLPFPLAHRFTTMGNFWFLRVLHMVQAKVITKKGKSKKLLSWAQKADWMAISSGPGAGQFPKTTSAKEGYSESVRNRVKDFGMSQKIRLYRDGLFSGTWEKSLETVVALSEIPSTRSGSGAGLFEDGPPGSLRVPATIIYGKNDMAFESRLCLDSIGDYLVKGSQVFVANECGHWMPHEEEGVYIIEAVTAWALQEGDEKDEGLRKRVERLGEDVRWVVEK